MIPYVEILKWNNAKTSIEPFGLIEPSQCWFELSYYETGEFEIYAAASLTSVEALQKGNFVRIPNKPYLWVITSIQYEFNTEGGRMVDAKGYEAKWIVSKRIIRDPLQLPSNLVDAMKLLFDNNLGSKAISQRRINGLTYDFSALSGKTTEAQATRGNLYEFSCNLLKLHQSGLISTYLNGNLRVEALVGQDRSESILFSQSMDNLISATYYTSDSEKKTHCQIVSTFSETTGTGAARTTTTDEYVAYYPDETEAPSGIDRIEMLLQSNLSTKVTQEDGTEIEIDPSSQTYQDMQKSEGASALAEKIEVVEFNGEIDLQNSNYEFATDFFIGDLVMVRDEYFGYSAKARIIKYTFKQDESGYGEEAEYGE